MGVQGLQRGGPPARPSPHAELPAVRQPELPVWPRSSGAPCRQRRIPGDL